MEKRNNPALANKMKSYIESKTQGNSRVYADPSSKGSKMLKDGGVAHEKINIFEQKDSNLMRRDALDQIGYEEQNSVPLALRSVT
jgi:hypothetical protein